MPSATDNISTMPAAPMLCASRDHVSRRVGRRLGASIACGIYCATMSACLLAGCARPLAKPALKLPAQDASTGPASMVIAGESAMQSPAPAPDATAEAAGSVAPSAAPEVFAAAVQDPPAPASEGASVEAGADAAGYRTVGGVLAEVNGKPIFSEEVIEAVRNVLRGGAKRQPSKELFLQDAQRALATERDERIRSELLRLVAERNLTREDRQRATFAATQFRVNRITAAGGSEARAREIALRDDQMTLEKLVEDTEKRFLWVLFLQAIIQPRATPSADEIRDYFRRHPEVHSAQGKGEIEFLLIEINGASADGAVRAQNVRSLALAGEDFATLAKEHNDNAAYKESGGAIPGMPLGRGDFRWPAVDAAVWNTPEGEITPTISDDEGRRLFIAKVTRRVEAHAVGFDVAQARISQSIASERHRELIAQYLSEAQRYAAITPKQQMDRNLQTALEVVAQQYESWRAE